MITSCVPWHVMPFFFTTQTPLPPSPVGNSLSSVHQNPTSGNRDAYSETTMETESVAKPILKIGTNLLPESRRTEKVYFKP